MIFAAPVSSTQRWANSPLARLLTYLKGLLPMNQAQYQAMAADVAAIKTRLDSYTPPADADVTQLASDIAGIRSQVEAKIPAPAQ